jgi:hypothetical protein
MRYTLSTPKGRDAAERAATLILESVPTLTRRQQLKDSTEIYNSETTESFLRQHEGRFLPGWASYRNVVHTDRWKRHFVGTSVEDPRPICSVECPECGAAAWAQCRNPDGKLSKENHASRAKAALYCRTTPPTAESGNDDYSNFHYLTGKY